MVGIYKITSPKGRVYIGQSWNFKRRRKEYGTDCTKRQLGIYNSIQKYGYDNHKFDIIHELPVDIDQSILNTYEVLYYNQYKSLGFKMLNGKEPGKGGRMTDEVRFRISKSHIGKKHSEETKLKIRLARTKQIIQPDHGKRISEGIKNAKQLKIN